MSLQLVRLNSLHYQLQSFTHIVVIITMIRLKKLYIPYELVINVSHCEIHSQYYINIRQNAKKNMLKLINN